MRFILVCVFVVSPDCVCVFSPKCVSVVLLECAFNLIFVCVSPDCVCVYVCAVFTRVCVLSSCVSFRSSVCVCGFTRVCVRST